MSIIRTEDNKPIEKLSINSHKKIWFTCDDCGCGVLQSYRNYLKSTDGHYCRLCRNVRSANKPEVLEKHRVNSIKRWDDPAHKEMMSKKLTVACQQAWDNDDGTRRKNLIDNNPMKRPEVRQKVSKSWSPEMRERHSVNNHMHTPESKERHSKAMSGTNSPMWKGGYGTRGIPTYDTFAHKISFCECTRRSPDDENILEVQCYKCHSWYVPSTTNVGNRISSIIGRKSGENHFYCSDECKESCSIFGQLVYPKGLSPTTTSYRPLQGQLRKLVLERDNNTCQRCNTQFDPSDLVCHHIDPVVCNPIESADVDNCMTLCTTCDREVHDQDGCRYHELRSIDS